MTLSRLWWRIRLVGKENIPKSGPFVMAPVHRSYVDSFVAAALVHRRMRFMGKSPLWRRRWSGALFTSLGAFPVDRGAPDRVAMRKCEEILA
ncbi:MAG: lysophospholipid acyltransferase family protein, partial [Acidimicrobiales bacterium]